jgi:hypothetical protein
MTWKRGGNKAGTVVCKGCGGQGHNRRTCTLARELQANAGASNARKQASEEPADRQAAIAQAQSAAMAAGYHKIFAALSDPPLSPLKLNRWAQRIVALCLRETAQGRGYFPLNAEIIKLTTAIVRLTPKDIIYEAGQLLKGDALGRKSKAKGKPLDAPVEGSRPLR